MSPEPDAPPDASRAAGRSPDASPDAPPVLELRGVSRRFGDVIAVADADLAVAEGELLTLLGPSGCGKTTLLRLVAGFETPDEGRILFRGEDVTGRSPQRRGFGMVFQNYALFPHLDVGRNVGFGLRARGDRGADVRDRVRRALERVDLPGFADRRVQELSGGQQQRVALARALAIEPPLLLLDEPLSNLDAALRERTRTEIRRLVKELGLTALFVTHDQEEAFDLSDRVAVMRAGRILQVGTPERLYREPADRFVAGFVGRANVLPARLGRPVTGADDPGSVVARLDGDRWRLPREAVRRVGAVPRWGDAAAVSPGDDGGEELELLVRPEDLALEARPDAGGRSDPDDALDGVVRERRFRGAVTAYRVERDGGPPLEVLAPPDAAAPGDAVRVRLREGGRVHAFPRADGPGPGPAPASPGPADGPSPAGG